MFTGIIEIIGKIISIENKGTNRVFRIQSAISPDLKPDQSVAHNGVCLTIEGIEEDIHQVTAIHETLLKTNLGNWQVNNLVNLERCLTPNGRLDGHFVQGHVDTTALCIEKKELGGSWQFRFEFPAKFAKLVIEKGSIALNGISLTVFDVTEQQFSVAIIPYTHEHTNMKNLEVSDTVNLEFDMVGKYVVRGMELSAIFLKAGIYKLLLSECFIHLVLNSSYILQKGLVQENTIIFNLLLTHIRINLLNADIFTWFIQ